MNIKKWLFTLAAAGLFTTYPADYCRAQTAEAPKPAAAIEYVVNEDYSFLNGKAGVMLFSRWNEETVKNSMNKSWGCKIENLTFDDSIIGCLSMLKSGRADFMITFDMIAAYITQRNPGIKSIVSREKREFVMILRKSDSALRDSFNSAIKKLKDNGTIGELEKKWIYELPAGQEPAFMKIEKTPDTETVYVGVSGAMPPLDYVLPDGRPAGFNIALLAEISKVTGKNIEVVSLDSQARFAALESKKIDVFFWTTMPVDKDVLKSYNENAAEQIFSKKFAITEPYCIFKRAFLLKK